MNAGKMAFRPFRVKTKPRGDLRQR